MRIAQISPLYESVPPRLYGGTERVVHYLTEALVDLGHEVTLFASADSKTSAKLVPCAPESLRLARECVDPLAHHICMVEQVAQRAHQFDVLHGHVDYLTFSLARRVVTPQVTTLHGRLDIPDLQPVFRLFGNYPVVSISDAQRTPLPNANWVATVQHGLPETLHQASDAPGAYFAFLGRISPEKRVDRAIEIAKRSRTPIRIAAKIAEADRRYFESEIRPLLDHPLVEFIGEIGESKKGEFLRGAKALLFPIDWPEPFGLVMIEAMACGTPVVAMGCGSVPEVIEDGVTGFVVDGMEDAVAKAGRVDQLDRRRCRREFERRFSVRRMAQEYLAVYQSLIDRERRLPLDAEDEPSGIRRIAATALPTLQREAV